MFVFKTSKYPNEKIAKNVRVGCNKAKSFLTKTVSNLLQNKSISKSRKKKYDSLSPDYHFRGILAYFLPINQD